MGETNLIASIRADINGYMRDLERGVRASRDFGRESSRGFDSADTSARRLDSSASGLSTTFRALGAVVAGLGLAAFAREGFQLATQLTSINRTLVATTGGIKQAAEAFEFVRTTTRRLGTDLFAGAKAFSQLANASRGTRLEGQGIRDIFESLTTATTALGLGTDQYGRLLTAVTQILTKGRIQTEELLQISEAGIPIYKELADAIGITGNELSDALSKGKIPAEALLLVSGKLQERFKSVAEEASGTTQIAFATLVSVTKEATAEFFQAVASSGALNSSIRELTNTIIEFTGSLDINSITKFVDQIVRFANFAITNVGSKVSGLVDAFGLIKSVGDDIVAAFGGPGTNVNTVLEAVIGQKVEVEALDDAWGDLGDTIEGVGSQAKTASTDLNELAKEIKNLATGLSPEEIERELNKTFNAFVAIRKRAETENTGLFNREIQERLRTFNEFVSIREDAEREATREFEKTISERTKLFNDFVAIRRRAEQEQEQATRRAEAIARRPIEQALNNIQDAFAGTFENILNGELDSVQDFADSLKDILFKTFAEIASSRIIGPAFESALEDAGLLEGTGVAPQQGTFARGIGAAGLGLGAGFATSGVLSQAGVGGTANGVISGALGGGVAGFQVAGPVGAAVGAAGGALIGSGVLQALNRSVSDAFGGGTRGGVIAGLLDPVQGLQALGNLLNPTKQQRLAVQTTAGRPGIAPSDNALVQGAFGTISLINERTRRADAQEVARVVAEFDRTIFEGITARQRAIVTATLQAPVSSTITGQANADTDNALAEVLVKRSRLIIESLAGAAVAQRVVGTVTNDPSIAEIGTIQSRVTEALGILRLIGEFEAGPTTEAADAIRLINEEFTNLISRANEFGIATGELAAEQARRLAEIAAVVNRDVTQRILNITDPNAAQEAILAERQRKEFENARDANANLIELERLHVLERQELARELQETNTQVVEETESIFDRVEDVLRGVLSQEQEIAKVFAAFVSQRNEVSQLSREYQELGDQYNTLLEASILLGRGVGDIIDTFETLGNRLLEQAAGSAQAIIDQLTSPFEVVRTQIATQIAEFARLVSEGFLSPSLFDRLQRIVTASAVANEALRIIGGGASSPIEQVANAFQQFIGAGNPLSAAGQELFNLTEMFINLKEAADLLGFSTNQLEESFVQQASGIRERLLENIDQQLSGRQQSITSINDFLANLRTGAEQPIQARLGAAQEQFQRDLRSDDINRVLASATQLRDLARQQFGSAQGFFQVQRDIEIRLGGLREVEQSRIDVERQRLIEQADNERQQIQIGQQSLNTLQQLSRGQGQTVNAIGDLIVIARRQNTQSNQLQDLLERLLARVTL